MKSVCAFANGIGGTLIFGIDDDRNVVGLSKPQEDAEKISRLIKDRITPTPDFKLEPEAIEDKTILKVMVKNGSFDTLLLPCRRNHGDIHKNWE